MWKLAARAFSLLRTENFTELLGPRESALHRFQMVLAKTIIIAVKAATWVDIWTTEKFEICSFLM